MSGDDQHSSSQEEEEGGVRAWSCAAHLVPRSEGGLSEQLPSTPSRVKKRSSAGLLLSRRHRVVSQRCLVWVRRCRAPRGSG